MHRLLLFIKDHKKFASLVLLLSDILFFILTSPDNSSLFVMVIAFSLVFGSLYVGCRLVFSILRSLGYLKVIRKWVREALTVLIFIFIIMQSVGQLSIVDALALIPVSIVGYFYYSFISGQKQSD